MPDTTTSNQPISKLFALAAVAATLATMSVGAAKADWLLDGNQVRALVTDKRIYLKVPFGGEFPLFYASNGRVTGDGTALGLGRHLAPRETGRWWVSGSQLCQQFPTWYKGKTSCFKLRPTGAATLRWRRDDGYSGRARIGG
ncbi:hypothetical protein [Oricola sp.]|uniref:hypothetical protein n=1 Tax=Oricola sp. TaxID=1979950 RepID=UPI003BABD028